MLKRFVDDVGVLVAMVVITFIALVVVIIKVILVHNEVRRFQTFTKLETNFALIGAFRLTIRSAHLLQWNK